MMNLTLRILAFGMVLGFSQPVFADEETPLAEQMDEIASSLKKLRKAENFEQKAALARDAGNACLASLDHQPKMFESVKDKAELERMTADYKRLMGLVYSKLAELELAYLSKDDAKAKTLLEELNTLKKEGHKAYIEDDE